MAAVPTVYFIDDSATMREVIKIAFRKENMEVMASHDATAALAEIEQTHPDVVITDVIMPEKDGYEVCQFIKNHPDLAKTPVILMSGVVNRAVAERAFAVKADELLRKPFQPQDLIARVRHLLNNSQSEMPTPAAAASAAAALTAIFSPAVPPAPPKSSPPSMIEPWAAPETAHELVTEPSQVFAPVFTPPPASGFAPKPMNGSNVTKLRLEVLRLEGLVKKLQAELNAEREYCRALEAHVKTLQETD